MNEFSLCFVVYTEVIQLSSVHGCFTVDIYGYLDVQLHIYVKMILVAH